MSTETKHYHFEQDRKQFCTDLAYLLRNPQLSDKKRRQFIEQLRDFVKTTESNLLK